MLSATTQHMLRAMVQLARLPEGSTILGRDLARRADVPPQYLSKILLVLRNAGFVEATRGHGGGYRLRVAPEEIRLVDVVELFEGVNSVPGCLLGEKHECSDQEACPAHAMWKEVRAAYVRMLENNTIADLAVSREAGRGKRGRQKRGARSGRPKARRFQA